MNVCWHLLNNSCVPVDYRLDSDLFYIRRLQAKNKLSRERVIELQYADCLPLWLTLARTISLPWLWMSDISAGWDCHHEDSFKAKPKPQRAKNLFLDRILSSIDHKINRSNKHPLLWGEYGNKNAHLTTKTPPSSMMVNA